MRYMECDSRGVVLHFGHATFNFFYTSGRPAFKWMAQTVLCFAWAYHLLICHGCHYAGFVLWSTVAIIFARLSMQMQASLSAYAREPLKPETGQGCKVAKEQGAKLFKIDFPFGWVQCRCMSLLAVYEGKRKCRRVKISWQQNSKLYIFADLSNLVLKIYIYRVSFWSLMRSLDAHLSRLVGLRPTKKINCSPKYIWFDFNLGFFVWCPVYIGERDHPSSRKMVKWL